MARQSLLAGTAVLSLASLVNRVLGFFYQILLIRILHAEGVGLLSMVFPLYIMALVMGSAGIPAAVAKLVAETQAQGSAWRIAAILRLAAILTAFSSLSVSALAFLLAPWLTQRIFANPDVYFPFICLLPSVPVVSLCSVLRGLYQGWQDMTPTAWSQFIEQVVRVGAALTLAYCLAPLGVAAAASGAALGVVAGETAGFAFLIYLFRRHFSLLVPTTKSALGQELRPLLGFALPVTFTRLSSTLFLSLEALLIPQRLVASGYPVSGATALYGQFAGVAETLLYTPSIVTVSLATALVPAVAEAVGSGNQRLLRQRINNAIRLTLLVGIPSATVLHLLAVPLCQEIFGYPEAGASLRLLALGAPFLYLQQTTTSILQGLGFPFSPWRNLAIASLFKLLLIYWLTALPEMNISGAALAFTVSYTCMALLNLLELWRRSGFLPPVGEALLKPSMATLAAASLFLWLGWDKGPLALSLPGFALLFIPSSLIFQVVQKEDWRRLQMITGKIFREIKRRP
ncbi:putative polysaccharide biosynthesis protein [Desulfothermobacter acidiphilus]|uniref:putative polysaccharide biosynthesis protein n=1 Tax=Desulfothermobacter acidiphilus TaxID=1938353 RepID=UPI003F8A1158